MLDLRMMGHRGGETTKGYLGGTRYYRTATGETFDWPADTPLGIGSGVKTVTISGLGAATTALVM